MRWLVAFIAAVSIVQFADATPTRAAGWVTHHSTAKPGFSVQTPSSWIDFTRLSPQVLVLIRTKPVWRAYAQIAARSKAIKMILVDRATVAGSPFHTNLDVVQLPSGRSSLRDQRAATIAGIEGTGVVVGPLRSSLVRLPAGEALEIHYQARSGVAAPLIAQQQFVFVRDGYETVLTYSTAAAAASQYAAMIRAGSRSFRFAN